MATAMRELMWSEAEWDEFHDRQLLEESQEIERIEDEFLDLAATVGPDHPEALATHVRLIRLFDPEASVDPLLDSSAEALSASCARVLGPDHDLTFDMREFAAVADYYRGNADRGLARLDALVADRTTASGPDDERTLALRVRRARVRTADVKRDEEGTPERADWDTEWTTLIADTTRALGADHLLTLEARTWLAFDYCEMGENAKEEAGYAALVADRTRIQGPEHQDTLSARERHLSCTIHHPDVAGTASDSDFEKDARQLIDDCVRVLGVEDPVTQNAMQLLEPPEPGGLSAAGD
jgi:hypothetical protein